MNSKLIIGIVVLVLLGGVGYMVMSKKTGTPSSPFASIKDALSKSLSLECSFTDETGRQTKAYIKSGAVRSDFTGKTAQESGSAIVKGKKMYFWSDQGGFMMEVPDVTPAPGQENEQLPQNARDVMDTLEQYKESCKPAVVSDSLFTPPPDIKFQDFSQMMQQAAPPSAGEPNAIPSIDYTQYMQNLPEVSPEQ